MWQHFFDHILLVNLPDRTDRLKKASAELDRYGIKNFEVVPAVKKDNGAEGLWMTMKALLEYFKAKTILVFEDDLLFVSDPNEHLPPCLHTLSLISSGWNIFHLGPNTHSPLQAMTRHLLYMQKCRSTHAVAYSPQGIDLILQKMKESNPMQHNWHYDIFLEKEIQPLGGCFCSYPMICTQRSDVSDISNGFSDQSYIEERFLKNTRHLYSINEL
jgi:hypothetical protein